jgi:PilZ domain
MTQRRAPGIKFTGPGGRREPRHNVNGSTDNNENGKVAVERRLHTRHRARTVVYITVPGGRRKLCKAVNLSATGVFIETSNLGLRKGQHVVLSFAINLGAITKLHRRTAVVAHVSRGGTGLMMESFAQSSS